MRPKVPPTTCASDLIMAVFSQARYAFQQHMAFRKQRDQQALECVILADDQALDFEQCLLDQRGRCRHFGSWLDYMRIESQGSFVWMLLIGWAWKRGAARAPHAQACQ